MFRQLGVLFWRAGMDMARNPMLAGLHWGLALLMGLGAGLVFKNVQNDIAGAQDRLGAPPFECCPLHVQVAAGLACSKRACSSALACDRVPWS